MIAIWVLVTFYCNENHYKARRFDIIFHYSLGIISKKKMYYLTHLYCLITLVPIRHCWNCVLHARLNMKGITDNIQLHANWSNGTAPLFIYCSIFYRHSRMFNNYLYSYPSVKRSLAFIWVALSTSGHLCRKNWAWHSLYKDYYFMFRH